MAERQFRMVLPKYDNAGARIDTEIIREYAEQIAERFGGVTVYGQTLGCYIGEGGELQCEENVALEVVRTDADEGEIAEDHRWFQDLARDAGRSLGQEAIFVQEETDTQTTFVPGQRRASLPPGMREHDFFKKLID